MGLEFQVKGLGGLGLGFCAHPVLLGGQVFCFCRGRGWAGLLGLWGFGGFGHVAG